MRVTEFLEEIVPTKVTQFGRLTYLTFKNEGDTVQAMKQIRKRGVPATRNGCSIFVGRAPRGNPFVDQPHFQHVFQQHLLKDPEANYALYRGLITEELRELDASATPEEHLDALIDLIYVVIGAGVALGHDMQGAWDEVHRTNMAKLDANGEPILRADGKILKPAGWIPPRLTPFIGHTLAKFRERR